MKKKVLVMKKSAFIALCLKYGIMRKGGKLPVGSIRTWGGVEYIKVAPGDWRERKVQGREPWDTSSEKAKELKMSDFGPLDEVRKMAKMPRTAQTKEETITILKKIAAAGNLTSKSGIVASLTGRSIGKIMSESALHQSFNTMAHWQAAANVDKLFSNAIEPWKFELDPRKYNENLKDRRYLYAPMEYKGRIIPVKFTVKEYKQTGLDKRLYSLEAINVDL